MDKTIARYVARSAFESWAEMADLVAWTKDHLDPAEHKMVAKAIATACAEVIFEVQNRIFAQYPELEQEHHESIAKYHVPI